MSQAGIINVAGSGGGPIETISGNDGVQESPVGGNFSIVTANATPQFKGTSGTETLNFGLSNLLLGDSGTHISGAGGNVGYGVGALTAMTTAGNCVAIGFFAGHSLTTASASTLVGSGSGSSITSGSANTFIGNDCANAITTGSGNVSLGNDALGNALTSVNCIVIGSSAATNYVGSESSNIIIGNVGVVSESNVIRIGTQGNVPGTQNKCFIAGIDGVNVGSTANVVTEVSGQLGTAVLTAGSGISITTGANTITISGQGGGLTWSDNSGTFTAVANHGYFISAASTPTMPASPNEGDVVSFILDAAAALTITGNTGQKLRINTALSASAGTAVTSTQGNTVRFVYRSIGTTWFSEAVNGTFNVT